MSNNKIESVVFIRDKEGKPHHQWPLPIGYNESSFARLRKIRNIIYERLLKEGGSILTCDREISGDFSKAVTTEFTKGTIQHIYHPCEPPELIDIDESTILAIGEDPNA